MHGSSYLLMSKDSHISIFCSAVCVCTCVHVLIHISKYSFCCSPLHSLEAGSFMEPGIIPVSINSRDPPVSAHCKGRYGHANF